MRSLVTIALSVLLALTSTGLSAANPVWTERSLRPAFAGVVTDVAEGPRTGVYVVRVAAGLSTGFTNGMVCDVRRGEAIVSSLVLVQTSLNEAAGLITSSSQAGFIPAVGDQVLPRINR